MVVVLAAISIIGIMMIAIPIMFEMKSPKIYLCLGISFVVISVSFIGYFIKPPIIYDLYRHYQLIDKVRNQNWSFFYSSTVGIPRLNANYEFTFFYNMIITFIANYLTNGVLPVIAALTYYVVFLYVYFNEFSDKSMNNINLLLSMLMCSAMMPYLYIFSGIRNSMSVAFAALGIYQYFKVHHNLIKSLIPIVIGILIHPIAAVAVVILLMHKFKPNLIYFICIILVPIVLEPIMEWCRLKSGNDFLFKVGAKYYNYTKVREDNQGRVFLYVAIILTVIWCVMILIFSLNQKNENKNHTIFNDRTKINKYDRDTQTIAEDLHLASGIWWYTIISLAFTQSYTMMIRFPYLLGCFSPFFIKLIFGEKMPRHRLSFKQVIVVGSTLGFSLLILYENIAWLKS